MRAHAHNVWSVYHIQEKSRRRRAKYPRCRARGSENIRAGSYWDVLITCIEYAMVEMVAFC